MDEYMLSSSVPSSVTLRRSIFHCGSALQRKMSLVVCVGTEDAVASVPLITALEKMSTSFIGMPRTWEGGVWGIALAWDGGDIGFWGRS